MSFKVVELRGIMLWLLIVGTPAYADDYSLEGGYTSDPIINYIWLFGLQNTNLSILRIEFDFDNDGRNEVLISNEGALNGKMGNIWSTYIPTEEGYRLSDTLVSFRNDAYFLGYVEELESKAIISYLPDSSEAGVITFVTINNGLVKEGVLKEIKWENKESKEYEFFFGGFGKESKVKSEVTIENSNVKDFLP